MLRLIDTKNKRLKIKTMKTTNMITKKTIYTLAAFLALQFNTIFAAVNISESPVSSTENTLTIPATLIAPATPAEATFEDMVELNTAAADLAALAPVMPGVADFSDGAPVTEISIASLAPIAPLEADFEDETGTAQTASQPALAPVTPSGAEFEDCI